MGQVLLFNAIDTYDRGAALYSLFQAMNEKDPDAARAWLEETIQGKYLKTWLIEKADKPVDMMNALRDLKRKLNPNAWFSLTESDRKAITRGRDEISQIRATYASKLALLQPGTAEYREAKAQMYYDINQVYLSNPSLLKNEVLTKTPAQWSQQLEEWQTDRLMDDYMQLAGQRPKRVDYEKTADYKEATAAWEEAKGTFLKTYPQVEERLAGGIAELESLRDKMNADWDAALDRIAVRNDAIEAAEADIAKYGRTGGKGAKAQDQLDILYLQNELDFSLLEKDYATSYFQKEDFDQLPFGQSGPQQLSKGITLPRFTVLNDFDRVRYEKAVKEGRLDEFLAQEQYGRDMKAAVSYAKGGSPFGEFDGKKFYDYMNSHPNLRQKYFEGNIGKQKQWGDSLKYSNGIAEVVALAERGGTFDPAVFVREMKKRPWLRDQYFARHKGKKEQWAATDRYIRHIGVWGKLVGAERWDAAARAWDNLPLDVRQRYLDTHPDSRIDINGDFTGGRGGGIEYDGKFFKSEASRDRYIRGSQYFNAIKPWGEAAASGNWERADAIWAKLPQWVKDRYESKHKARSVQTGQYAGYMQTWIKLFDKSEKEAMDYFAKLPQWAKDRYYKKHPDKKAQYETSDKMFVKLQNYFAADPAGQAAYLNDNQDLAAWLSENGGSGQQQTFAILAAYREIPKEDAWLRRVFREKYPDIFSAEALGKRKLDKVFKTLLAHPEVSDEFEAWVKAIWESYDKMLRESTPRPANTYIQPKRNVPARKYRKSFSAERASR
jgi:hypothetical protein